VEGAAKVSKSAMAKTTFWLVLAKVGRGIPLWLMATVIALCHTPVLKSRTEASIHVPRMFNHTHSNNMINR
jgi:hypothetical protein